VLPTQVAFNSLWKQPGQLRYSRSATIPMQLRTGQVLFDHINSR